MEKVYLMNTNYRYSFDYGNTWEYFVFKENVSKILEVRKYSNLTKPIISILTLLDHGGINWYNIDFTSKLGF